MKFLEKLTATALVLALMLSIPAVSQARVIMMGNVSDFSMDILPTANFTPDDWFSNPNLWTITITNSAEDGKTVKLAIIDIEILSGNYGNVLSGKLTVVGPYKSFLTVC